MPRIRTIKPEFWRDDGLASVSAEACLLAVGLLNYADDEGYFNAHPRLVEADVFPLRELSGSTTVLLRELSDIGYIQVFSGTDGKTYGLIVNFCKHQVINKKAPSKIKALCGLPEDYGSATVVLPPGKERKGKEKEIKEKINQKEKPAAQKRDVVIPEGVSQNTWADWLQLRKAKRAPVTQTAVDQIAREATKAGWTLERALAEATARGWTGFKADWLQASTARNNRPAVYGAGLAIFGNLEAKHDERIIDVYPAAAGVLDQPDF